MQANITSVVERNKLLENVVAEFDSNHPVLRSGKVFDMNFGEAGQRMENFIPLKSSVADNFNKRYLQPTINPKYTATDACNNR